MARGARIIVVTKHLLDGQALSAALLHCGVARAEPLTPNRVSALDGASVDAVVLDTAGFDAHEWIELLARILALAPKVSVLALVEEEAPGFVAEAGGGAFTTVVRGQSLAYLAEAVDAAALSAGRERARHGRRTGQYARSRTLEDRELSGREVAVLGGVARGMTNEQIARQTSVSPSTVKNQLYSACRKLGVSCRSHAVAEAISRGIIAPNGEPAPERA